MDVITYPCCDWIQSNVFVVGCYGLAFVDFTRFLSLHYHQDNFAIALGPVNTPVDHG